MRVLHAPKRAAPSQPPQGTPPQALRPAGRFARHFLEMCVVMCVGGGVLTGLVLAATWVVGLDHHILGSAVWSGLTLSVMMAVAMVGWMRFRRMDWRPTLEMASSSLVAGGALVLGHGLGIVSADALVPSVCPVACVAMLVVMLFRLPLYTAEHGHHGAAAAFPDHSL
jgi:hypothetical protein